MVSTDTAAPPGFRIPGGPQVAGNHPMSDFFGILGATMLLFAGIGGIVVIIGDALTARGAIIRRRA